MYNVIKIFVPKDTWLLDWELLKLWEEPRAKVYLKVIDLMLKSIAFQVVFKLKC
jgi:hypothetical protein